MCSAPFFVFQRILMHLASSRAYKRNDLLMEDKIHLMCSVAQGHGVKDEKQKAVLSTVRALFIFILFNSNTADLTDTVTLGRSGLFFRGIHCASQKSFQTPCTDSHILSSRTDNNQQF